MTLKSFSVFVIVLAFVALSFYIAGENKDPIDFTLFRTFSVGAGTLVFLSFLAGCAFSLIFGLLAGSRRVIRRWRESRIDRKARQLDEAHREGLRFLQEGDLSGAEKRFNSVLNRKPDHVASLLGLAEIGWIQGKRQAALGYLEKARSASPKDPRVLYAVLSRHTGPEAYSADAARTEQVLREIVKSHPKNQSARKALRDLFVAQERWTEAAEAQESLGSSESGDEERRLSKGIRYRLAMEMIEKGDARSATSNLEQILKEDPEFVPARMGLGRALAAQGEDTAALKAWADGYERSRLPVLVKQAENHFLQKEDPDAAIRFYRDLIAKYPEESIPRFFLARLFSKLEMLDDVATEVEKLQGEPSTSPTIRYLQGRTFERSGRPEAAAELYRSIIRDVDALRVPYKCSSCSLALDHWLDQCPSCQTWDSMKAVLDREKPRFGPPPHTPAEFDSN